MTSNSRAHEAFYESEATLRLVDQEIHELRGTTHSGHGYAGESAGDLPHALERANEQILNVLARVRAQRSATRGDVTPAFLGDIETSLTEVAALLNSAG